MKFINNIIIFSTLLLGNSFVKSEELTLREIKERLHGQEVILLGNKNLKTSNWNPVNGSEEIGYKILSSRIENENIAGEKAVIVYIDQEKNLSSIKNKIIEKDIFGAQIDNSLSKNPYIAVLVKVLKDQRLIGATGFYNTMVGSDFQTIEKFEAMKKEISHELSLLNGKKLYKTGFTKIYDSTIELSDLLDNDKREKHSDNGISNLTPLKVIDAKFLEASLAIVIKVEISEGQNKLLYGDLKNYYTKYGYKPTKLDRMDISAADKIPSEFTKEELSSIKNGQIFRGMSKNALFWSWGYADKINDWGRAGKQYIYNKTQFVYVDGNKIRDWQNIK